MAFSEDDNKGEEISEVNVIPLVDIMLVLLIIFMVSAPMMNDSVEVTLPKAQAKSAASQDQPVELAITKDQRIFIGKTEVKFDSLAEKLAGIFSNREKKEIFIRADESSSHGFVIKVMASIQRAGVYRISFLTDPRRE